MAPKAHDSERTSRQLEAHEVSSLPFSTAASMASSSPSSARANSHAGTMLRAASNRPASTSFP